MKKIGELKQIITKETKKSIANLQKKLDEGKKYGLELGAKTVKITPITKGKELVWKWTYFK